MSALALSPLSIISFRNGLSMYCMYAVGVYVYSVLTTYFIGLIDLAMRFWYKSSAKLEIVHKLLYICVYRTHTQKTKSIQENLQTTIMMKERKEEKNDMRIDKFNTHTQRETWKKTQTDSQSDFDKKINK